MADWLNDWAPAAGHQDDRRFDSASCTMFSRFLRCRRESVEVNFHRHAENHLHCIFKVAEMILVVLFSSLMFQKCEES